MMDNRVSQAIPRLDETDSVTRLRDSSLRNNGYQVLEADTGRESLTVDGQEVSSATLLELRGTSSNGEIKLSDLTGTFDPNTPVVLITSLDEGMRTQNNMDERGSASDPMAPKRLFLVLPEQGENGQRSITLSGENSKSHALLGGRAIEISTFPFSIGRIRQREMSPDPKDITPNIPPKDRLFLPDPRPYRISRRHFRIELIDERYLVRDMGSRLGVVVNHNYIGGLQRSRTEELRDGENLLVVGGPDSPYRFILTV